MKYIRTAIEAFADMCEAFGAWLLEDPWRKLWKLLVIHACAFIGGMWIASVVRVAAFDPLMAVLFVLVPLIIASWSFKGRGA